MRSRSIDFGLMLQPKPDHFPPSDLWTYNRRLLETLSEEVTTLWVEDHLDWGETATLECFSTLSYAAAAFPRFHVGTLVLGQAYRNPALLAKMAANLQLLSGGRLVLGIGAGWKEDEYRAYGYRFPAAHERVEQLEEAAQILRALWQSSPATFTGKHYQIQNAHCEPRPDPPIPLLIGGGGEQRTLAVVAHHADWWNFNSCPVEVYAHKAEILKEHCQRIGRDFSEIRLTYLSTMSVSENPAQVVRSPEKHFVAGSSAEVIRELERFCEVGVTHFIFRFLDLPSLERFVQTVAPHFR
jgi:alkanesulfonate monooxygenase SsuD/methylene tetrahydromethanopterin reductase-like flavin-dependent oxidoreductase (luciferase family)